MLSKRFCDILAVVFILVLVLSIVLIKTPMDEFRESGSPSIAEMDQSLSEMDYTRLVQGVAAAIYWIFILVLAIQLHSRKLASMLDVVLVVLISPLAIVFYFLTLRGKLKKVELGNVSSRQEPLK